MFVQKQTAKAARVLRPKEKTWVCNIKFWAPGLGVVGGGSPTAYDAQQAGSMSCSCEQRPVVGYSSR